MTAVYANYQLTIDEIAKVGQNSPQLQDAGTLFVANNTAFPDGVVVGKHSVTSGNEFTAQSLCLSTWNQSDVAAQVNTAPLNLGVVEMRVASTTVLECRNHGVMTSSTNGADEMVNNAGINTSQQFNFQDGITITSGQELLFRVTPALKIPVRWVVECYSPNGNQIGRAVTYTTTASQTILSYTPVSDWSLYSFILSADTGAQVTGAMRLDYNGAPILETGWLGMDETAPQPMHNIAGCHGVLSIPIEGIEFQQGETLAVYANAWAATNSKFQMNVFGDEVAYSGGGGGGNTYSRGRVVNA